MNELPDIITPEKRRMRNKEFVDYVKSQIVKEYGVHIDEVESSLTVQKLKRARQTEGSPI